MACSPAMTFHVGKSDIPGRYLLRGDSEGQIVMWTLPEVTERQMTLVRQESFDRLPGKNYFLSKLHSCNNFDFIIFNKFKSETMLLTTERWSLQWIFSMCKLATS